MHVQEPESAAKCVEGLNNKEVGGKTLFCGRAQKKAEREAALKAKMDELRQERIAKYQGMNLYVKNLTDDVTDEQVCFQDGDGHIRGGGMTFEGMGTGERGGSRGRIRGRNAVHHGPLTRNFLACAHVHMHHVKKQRSLEIRPCCLHTYVHVQGMA